MVAVEDQRLVEEGAQGQLGPERPAIGWRSSTGTPSTNSAGPPADQGAGILGAGEPGVGLELDPGVGPGHRDRLEAAAPQAAQGRLRAGLVRRDHDAVDADTGAAAEGADPAQGLGGQGDRVGLGRHPAQLAAVVVVAVDEQRDRPVALLQRPQGGGVGEPGVERHRRQGDVVTVLAGVGARARASLTKP